MLNLYASQIESVSLHRVGNKHRGEPLFLSESPCRLNDEQTGLLKDRRGDDTDGVLDLRVPDEGEAGGG